MILFDDISLDENRNVVGTFPLNRSETFDSSFEASRTDSSFYETDQLNAYTDKLNKLSAEKGFDIPVPVDAWKRTLGINSAIPSSLEDMKYRANRIGLGTRVEVDKAQNMPEKDKLEIEAFNNSIRQLRETNPELTGELLTTDEWQNQNVDQTKKIRQEAAEAAEHGSWSGNMVNSLIGGFYFGMQEPENIAASAAMIALTPFTGGAAGATLGMRVLGRLGMIGVDATLAGAAEYSIADRKRSFRERLGMTEQEIDDLQISESLWAAGGAALIGGVLDGVYAAGRSGVRRWNAAKAASTPERRLFDSLVELEDPNPAVRLAAVRKVERMAPDAITSDVRIQLDMTKERAELELSAPKGTPTETHIANMVKAEDQLSVGKATPENIVLIDDGWASFVKRVEGKEVVTRADLEEFVSVKDLSELDTSLQAVKAGEVQALSPEQFAINDDIVKLQKLSAADQTPEIKQQVDELSTSLNERYKGLAENERAIYGTTDEATKNIPPGTVRLLTDNPAEQQVINDFVVKKASDPVKEADVARQVNELRSSSSTADRSTYDEARLKTAKIVTPEEQSVADMIVNNYGDRIIEHPETGQPVSIKTLFNDIDEDLDELDGIFGCLIS